ncbi:hypothetical protein Hanom_Chr15g01406821 [Helianthus anomalus]
MQPFMVANNNGVRGFKSCSVTWRDELVGVVEDDMEGVHSSQFLGKNGEEWANGGFFFFFFFFL